MLQLFVASLLRWFDVLLRWLTVGCLWLLFSGWVLLVCLLVVGDLWVWWWFGLCVLCSGRLFTGSLVLVVVFACLFGCLSLLFVSGIMGVGYI